MMDRVRDGRDNSGRDCTYNALHIDHTQSLADIIANNDHIRAKQPPILWTGRVVELEAVLCISSARFEHEWLINISQRRDIYFAFKRTATFAHTSTTQVISILQSVLGMLHLREKGRLPDLLVPQQHNFNRIGVHRRILDHLIIKLHLYPIQCINAFD